MADTTFLNTATTGMATNNVQNNVNQTNSNQQVVQNSANGTVGMNQTTQNGQMNPITIPIQIQPQIATTGQTTNVQNAQPNQNLQVQNSTEYNAPTPQTYNNTNANNNVIDFNQIYNSYVQQKNGNNTQNNTTNSGVKKSSYNTTIVTPTVTNLNSVKGQYQSEYADTVNGIISTLLSQAENIRNGDFGYDPTQDDALRLASEYAANSTLNSLRGSGVLNSSATAERIAKIVSD